MASSVSLLRAGHPEGPERAARNQGLGHGSKERAAALRELAGGSAALQMEHDVLSVTVDASTGEADAIVLKGTHAGRTWSSLTFEEKATVVELVGRAGLALVDILKTSLTD